MSQQTEVFKGLELALKMEADGKKYYLKASGSSANQAGRQLFKGLAQEEDEHARRFRLIYQRLKDRQGWPDKATLKPDASRAKTLFSQAMQTLEGPSPSTDSELAAVKQAMQMEDESYQLYDRMCSQAATAVEKDFFEQLKAEERGHYLALSEYQEYLKDPVYWFTLKEHPSLDGA